ASGGIILIVYFSCSGLASNRCKAFNKTTSQTNFQDHSLRPNDQLFLTLELIKLERQADLEQYRQKVLLRSLQQRTKEGSTWYPVTLKRDYIGTGERPTIEILRTNNLAQPHMFQSGRVVNVFSNATGRPEKEHVGGV